MKVVLGDKDDYEILNTRRVGSTHSASENHYETPAGFKFGSIILIRFVTHDSFYVTYNRDHFPSTMMYNIQVTVKSIISGFDIYLFFGKQFNFIA